MPRFLEVKFKGERKALFANPLGYPFKVGFFAIVEAEKGEDFGKINNIVENLKDSRYSKTKVLKVLRKSSPEDILINKQNRLKEKSALAFCGRKVEKHRLKMKLVDCEYQFDHNKITFYFTAEKRVDFRELVKDLATEYKTRIELRQIGVRDEARRQSGFGVCGQKLCCSRWIDDFSPITTQAAKDQNLPLNPNKLAGVCGRLKCCLVFERDYYNWAIKQYPSLAKEIKGPKGLAVVQRIAVLKESVLIKYKSNGEYEWLDLAQVKKDISKCNKGCGRKPANVKN